jgi:predicted permease
MAAFQRLLSLTAPLFLLVLVGYALTRWGRWPKPVADALTRFVFSVAIPALLFRLMSDFSRLPPVDARLLIAFFGGCLVVFVLGRSLPIACSPWMAWGSRCSRWAASSPTTCCLACRWPRSLGEASIPAVSLVLVFNSLPLWTLVTVSVEWRGSGPCRGRPCRGSQGRAA